MLNSVDENFFSENSCKNGISLKTVRSSVVRISHIPGVNMFLFISLKSHLKAKERELNKRTL